MSETYLRLIGTSEELEIAPEISAALARLAEEKDPAACFVVTRSGILWAKADAHDPATLHLSNATGSSSPLGAARPTRDFTPHWDRDNRVLTFGGRIVRRYYRSSPNQEAVLQAFEEQGWPLRIDDPLPYSVEVAPKPRLHDTIRWLNLKQDCLRFLGDGTGEGVCWKIVESSGLILHGDHLLQGDPLEERRPAA